MLYEVICLWTYNQWHYTPGQPTTAHVSWLFLQNCVFIYTSMCFFLFLHNTPDWKHQQLYTSFFHWVPGTEMAFWNSIQCEQSSKLTLGQYSLRFNLYISGMNGHHTCKSKGVSISCRCMWKWMGRLASRTPLGVSLRLSKGHMILFTNDDRLHGETQVNDNMRLWLMKSGIQFSTSRKVHGRVENKGIHNQASITSWPLKW